jgi:hypothetical protein
MGFFFIKYLSFWIYDAKIAIFSISALLLHHSDTRFRFSINFTTSNIKLDALLSQALDLRDIA